MLPFNQAIHMNNDGVTALRAGDQNRAIQYFEQSIKLMRQDFLSPEEEEYNEEHLTISSCCFAGKLKNATSTHTVEIPIKDPSQQDTIVYNQAIRLQPGGVHELYILDLKIVYMSAVLFNHALAHHFKAFSSCSKCWCGRGIAGGGDYSMMFCTLDKAERLYSLALELLDNVSLLKIHSGLVVNLACITNLSYIQYSKGDYANARQGVVQVARLIKDSYESNNDEGSGMMEMIKEEKIQNLLLSVLLLKPPMTAKAA